MPEELSLPVWKTRDGWLWKDEETANRHEAWLALDDLIEKTFRSYDNDRDDIRNFLMDQPPELEKILARRPKKADHTQGMRA